VAVLAVGMTVWKGEGFWKCLGNLARDNLCNFVSGQTPLRIDSPLKDITSANGRLILTLCRQYRPSPSTVVTAPTWFKAPQPGPFLTTLDRGGGAGYSLRRSIRVLANPRFSNPHSK